MDFDTWYELFVDKATELGFMGPFYKDEFYEQFTRGESPERCAEVYVDEARS